MQRGRARRANGGPQDAKRILERLFELEPLAGLRRLADDPPRFEWKRGAKNYHVVLYQEQGVLRLELPRRDVLERIARTALVGSAGAGVGALVATLANATEKKGSAAQFGLLLGLVVGAVAEWADASKPQRVFALEFDPRRREWMAYDGGLMHWMRQRLLPA